MISPVEQMEITQQMGFHREAALTAFLHRRLSSIASGFLQQVRGKTLKAIQRSTLLEQKEEKKQHNYFGFGTIYGEMPPVATSRS